MPTKPILCHPEMWSDEYLGVSYICFEEMEERNVFVRELVKKAQALEKENNTLKAQNAHLTKQLHASWKVMRAIANAMVTGKKL